MKFIISIVVLLACFFSLKSKAQKTLEITKEKHGKTKVYEVAVGDMIGYKLKGSLFYKKAKIANLQDSMIVFDNDSVIWFSQLKSIRYKKNLHLLGLTGKVLFAGVLILPLTTFNNIILDNKPVFNEKMAFISAGCLAAGFILYEIDIRRVKIAGKKLRVVEHTYENLGK